MVHFLGDLTAYEYSQCHLTVRLFTYSLEVALHHELSPDNGLPFLSQFSLLTCTSLAWAVPLLITGDGVLGVPGVSEDLDSGGGDDPAPMPLVELPGLCALEYRGGTSGVADCCLLSPGLLFPNLLEMLPESRL